VFIGKKRKNIEYYATGNICRYRSGKNNCSYFAGGNDFEIKINVNRKIDES